MRDYYIQTAARTFLIAEAPFQLVLDALDGLDGLDANTIVVDDDSPEARAALYDRLNLELEIRAMAGRP